MKKILYLLLILPLLFSSCNNDDSVMGEEIVEVSFCARLPYEMGTRASSTLSVDRVYCAVFENGEEIDYFRQTINIVNGEPIVYSPRLVKGRTYQIVFWASKEGAYDVTNMTAITRTSNTTFTEVDFNAFTAAISITVMGNYTGAIMLRRPIAQLNMGMTQEDWNGVANPETFNMVPTTTKITIPGKTTFNALTAEATGEEVDITYNLEVSGAEFVCAENTYKSIAMCYVLAESDKAIKDITYSVYDQEHNAIRENAVIHFVPFKRNYKTNLVGGLLTGDVFYTISSENFSGTDNDQNTEMIR